MSIINFCYDFVKFVSVISISTSLSFLFSYFFVYKPLKDKDKNFVEFIPYQKKYYDEFFELEVKDLKEEQLIELKNKVVKDITPNGEVIMFYNNDTNSFWYYSNYKNIYYKYLDSVAMKYSIEYDCKKICIDRKYLYEKNLYEKENKKNNKNEKVNDEKVNDEKVNDEKVFANFKNYNNNNNNNNNDNDYIFIEKSNIYSYKGKIEYYYNEKNDKNDKNDKNYKNVSYVYFKKIKDNKDDKDDKDNKDDKDDKDDKDNKDDVLYY